jgi:hypothetical protein
VLLRPGRGSRLARCGPADQGRRRRRPGRGRLGVAESLKHRSHQALDSWTVSSLAMKPTMDPVELAAKEAPVPGPSPGPSWGRETAVNSGQSRCPADNDIGRSTAVIRRHRSAGPYMACKGSGVQIPSAPPQVNGPLRRRPPRIPALAQQIPSNCQCVADTVVQGGGHPGRHRRGRLPVDAARRAAAAPHHPGPLSCRRCPEIVSSLVLPARRG